MPIEPINRPDGRHWCRPASADPEDSPVTCPDCGLEWEFDAETRVWSIVGQSNEVILVGLEEPLFDESPGD